MWWFTLLGIVIAALIKTFQWDRKVRAYVGSFGFWAIPIACVIGTLSPLCSCGILPVVIPMALSGVAIAPLIALLITSPVMDPTSFFLTYGALGPELAWWKFGGALFLGMTGGTITWFFERTGYFSGNIVRLSPVFNENGELASGYDIGCANGLILKTMTVTPRDNRWRFFFDRLLDVGLFVCIWVGLALVLEALIHVFVPIQWVTALVGQKGPGSVLAATIVALPLPAHQIPIVPILAGLQAKGIAVGADIAFLMAGPVTSIPASVALWAIFKPRVVVTFIVIGLSGSALLGLARMGLY
jgi:uncharacterized membrane protein YraQ (UPF0718 family)